MESPPAATEANRRTAFISGPVNPSQPYFDAHYAPRILEAIASGDRFVMGPAPGVDSMALQFLLAHSVPPASITMYCTEYESEHQHFRGPADAAGVQVKTAGIVTAERDAQMTHDSDYDILRYRTPEEAQEEYGAFCTPGHVTATERNERRRKALAAEAAGGGGVKSEREEAVKGKGKINQLWGKMRGKQ